MRGVSELEPTVIGLVGFFLPAILLSRENRQSSGCKEAPMATHGVHETGLTLTSGPNTGELAFIHGDYQPVTQMLKATRADKLHSRDG